MTVRAPSPTRPADPVPAPAVAVGPGPVAAQFSTGQVWLLVGLTMLAAGLRLFHLGEWSLWVDEAHTWRDATLPLTGEDGFLTTARARYPLSYLLLRGLLESGLLPHTSEGWLRLPFAFAGIVTVPLLALVGARVVGAIPALLAALFLAVNPWHIYWSQNARAYVFVALVAVLAAGLFFSGHRRGSRWRLAGGLGLAVLGGLFHPTGFLLVGALPCFPLLARQRLRGRRFAFGLLGIVAAMYLLPVLFQVVPAAQEFARAKPDASILHLIQTTAFYFRLPILVTAAFGAGLLLVARQHREGWFLICWGAVPLLVLAVVGSSVVKVTARYAFCSLPAVLLLAGVACHRVGQVLAREWGEGRRLRRGLLAAAVPAILLLDMLAYDYLYFTLQRGDRPQWRQAARFATRHAGDGGRLLVLTTNEPSLNYYLRPWFYALRSTDPERFGDRQVLPLLQWRIAEAGGGRAFVDRWIRRTEREGQSLFVIVTEPELQEIDRDGSLEERLRERFRQERRYPVWVGPKDQTVLVYRFVPPR